MDMNRDYSKLIELVHEHYSEINIEIVPQMTVCVRILYLRHKAAWRTLKIFTSLIIILKSKVMLSRIFKPPFKFRASLFTDFKAGKHHVKRMK